MILKAKYWASMPPPQALMRPHSGRIEKTCVKKQNITLYCRPRRPNRGPTAVEWKKIGYKSKILGFKAAPAGLNAAP